MRFFGFFSLLFLLLLSSCFDCYVYKCSFFVARKERTDVYTGQHQVGCNGEFASYDGEDFNRVGGVIISDMLDMVNLDFSNKDDVSDLAGMRLTKPALEVTEYVSFTKHHSSIVPQGIGSQLPNIKHFMFNFGVLSKLSREDLKQFPHVLSFDFKSNKLEYLEEDLFMDNSKLIYVELEDNDIMQVSSNIGLFRMKNLFYIHMERNRCINEVFYCKNCKDEELANGLKEFDTNLINKCADLEIMRRNMAQTGDALKSVQSTVAGQAESINQLNQGLNKMNSVLTEVQSKVNGHGENLNKMTAEITQISGNLRKVQDSVENFSQTIDRVYNLINMVIDKKKKIIITFNI